MTTALQPSPGFDWSRVTWEAPDAPASEVCSYCRAPLDGEGTALRLFSAEGWACVFCDPCAERWWGLTRFEPDDDSRDTLPDAMPEEDDRP